MKKREISAIGKINSSGKLSMYMGELNDFFSKHKGKMIVARFYVYPEKTSESLLGYYYHYVVPTIQKALYEIGERKTEEETEKWIREMSPIMCESVPCVKTGKYITQLKEIKELDNAELIEHIDYIKQLAAEDLNVYIEDPKTI